MMQSTVKLRDYQAEGIARLRRKTSDLQKELYVVKGRQPRLVFSSPTGSGKTECAVHLMQSCAAKGKRAIFLADRTSLVDQTQQRLDKYGLDYGLLWAQHTRDTNNRCLVVSSQTLESRGLEALGSEPVSLMIIDESHEIRQRIVNISKQMPGAVVIGLTATPLNTKMHTFYDGIVTNRTTMELMDEGVLVPMNIRQAVPDASVDTEYVGIKGTGEWDESQLGEQATEVVGDAIDSWHKVRKEQYGSLPQAPTIGFFPTVDACEVAANEFRATGIKADVVSYMDSNKVNGMTMQQVKIAKYLNGGTEVLLCPAVLGRGFDDPRVRIILDYYPLRKSLTTLAQRYGRGIRADQNDASKTQCTLIDGAGNINRLGAGLARFWAFGVNKLPKPQEQKAAKKKEQEEELVWEEQEFPTGPLHVPGLLADGWTLDVNALAKFKSEAAMVGRNSYIKAPPSMPIDDIWQQLCGVMDAKRYLPLHSKIKAANGAYKSLTGRWRKDKTFRPSEPTPFILRAQDHNYRVWRETGA